MNASSTNSPKNRKTAMTESRLLSIDNLTISFQRDSGDFRAVDGVSLDIGRGEILGLVGESGSGKSMTALATLDLIPQPGCVTGGRVIFDGQDIAGLGADDLLTFRGGRIGMIFQEPMTALNPTFTVGSQISEALQLHSDVTNQEARTRAIDFMTRVGFQDASLRYDSYPHQLSGGMRQRAMIAMALICEPELLIADEPTTALDATVQAQILDLLLEMREELNLAILFISHNLAVVSAISDRVAIMYAGKIMEVLPARELANGARHPYTTGLLETLPSMDKRGQRLPVLEGILTDTDRLRTGCPFAPRCSAALSVCTETMPDLIPLSDAHRAACHALESQP